MWECAALKTDQKRSLALPRLLGQYIVEQLSINLEEEKKATSGKIKQTNKQEKTHPNKGMLASYHGQLQIMPLCNPFTKSRLISLLGTLLLKKDNSDFGNC